jgi:hypothetical protein
VVLGHCPADQRAVGQRRPQAVDGGADGLVGRVLPGDVAWTRALLWAPGTAGMTCAIPGSDVATAATRWASRRVVAICIAPGAPVPKACWTWV